VTQKFDYYDAIAHLIPGTIGCLVILYFCDIFGIALPKPQVGSLGGLGIGIAIAYVIGHFLQSIASVLEPAYYFVWGGKPSIRLLESRSNLFSDDQRLQLLREFIDFLGVSEPCPHDKKARSNYYQRIFARCMAVCNRNKLGRVEAFVTSYGFHRVLLTTFLLTFGLCATVWGATRFGSIHLAAEKVDLLKLMVWIAGISTLIEVFRARKRAYYYAHEVIMMTSDYIRSSKSQSNLP